MSKSTHKPKIIAGVDITRRYHASEIVDMYRTGRLKPIALEGYVARADIDGWCEFVPWWEKFNPAKPRIYQVDEADIKAALRKDLPPIIKRTPQERVTSLMLRIMAEVKRDGTVPGLPEEKVREIVGEYWKNGITEVTEDMVRKVASHFLQVAENRQSAADYKRVVRQSPND